jgi:hypothetical protein
MDSLGTNSAGALRRLEGHRVTLALADGSRLDEVILVSCGRNRATTLWLDVDGIDVFVSRSEVLEAFEPTATLAA